ncbi:hypothetical protein BCR44DRAFT_1481543 [Catenaria anguillulae PL171]|uniref:Uncharacterized protein n=1 Tax=Catenaria anguillulae PL171 TaxID=765915 RepID=A0A1Y2I3K5_9FUNG|nr:hypothetical protein BCR44DRAFT_1481543 [Catenaria anguillulae PL171]
MYILCFTCLTGPALIIAGSLFFSSASVPTRENAVQQYTDAVTAWSASIANGPFSSSQFSVTTSAGTTSLVKTTSAGTEESWLKSREPTVPSASNHYRYEASVASLQSSTLTYPASNGNVATVNLAPQLVDVSKAVTFDSGNLNCRTGSCNQSDSSARQSCQNKPLCTDALLVSGFVFIGMVGCCIWACVACRRGRLHGGNDSKVVPTTTASLVGQQVQSTAAVPAPYSGYPAGGSYPMQPAPQPYAPVPPTGYQPAPPQYSPTQPVAYGQQPYGGPPAPYGQAPPGAYPPPQGMYAAAPSAPPPQGYYQQAPAPAPAPYGYPPQQPAPGGYPAVYEYPK